MGSGTGFDSACGNSLNWRLLWSSLTKHVARAVFFVSPNMLSVHGPAISSDKTSGSSAVPRLDPAGVGWQQMEGLPPWQPHTGSRGPQPRGGESMVAGAVSSSFFFLFRLAPPCWGEGEREHLNASVCVFLGGRGSTEKCHTQLAMAEASLRLSIKPRHCSTAVGWQHASEA